VSRRGEILKEMGLSPVWRLREPRAGATAADATDAVSSASAVEPSARPAVEVRAAAARAPGVAPSDDRRSQIMHMDWAALKACVAGCVACPLHEKRTQTVFGVGDENAEWLFVGEGPGAEEDAQGEPFVGQAGRLLDNMLAAIKMKRGRNVYIANVVKCRPPGNRNPAPEEALACEPHLQRQIELIRPRLIVALGRVAALNLLAREASIASLRGKVHHYRGTPLIVTYHPAYLLRNLPDKAKAWVDLRFAVETMKSLQNQAIATR
jgi:uracil-DNA glycosylase family 4